MGRRWTSVASVGDLLVKAEDLYPSNRAVAFPDRTLTYAEVAANSRRVAKALCSLGITAGDRVGVLMSNRPEFVSAIFGTTMIGAVVTPINVRFRTTELRHITQTAGLSALLVGDVEDEGISYLARYAEAIPELDGLGSPEDLDRARPLGLRAVVHFDGSSAFPWVTDADDLLERADGLDVDLDELRERVAVRDRCMMMFTSGTESKPKACAITHEALSRTSAVTAADKLGLAPGDCIWNPAPMFHISAFVALLGATDTGATYASMQHFDATTALDQLERERVSVMFSNFPAFNLAMMEHESFADRDLSAIKLVFSIGPPALNKRVQAAFPQGSLVSVYGSTELCGVTTMGDPADSLDVRASTCGRGLRGVEMRVVDPDSGIEVAEGERGHLLVKGFNVIDEYYENPEATAAAFDDEGWFATGDLVSISDGVLSFHGRLKDILRVGGENVSAAEVEDLLQQHPSVRLAQVVGVFDPRLDEVPVAFVEVTDRISEEDLIEYCRGKVASFKVPRHVGILEEWPMSATKIRKGALRDRAAELWGGVSR